MNRLKIYKTLAFITLIIELTVFFTLFGKIRNMIFSNQLFEDQNIIYLLLILAAILVLFLFVLFILLTNKNESENIYSKKQTQIIGDNSKHKESEKEIIEEETANIEYYISKILPKENTKLNLIKYSEKILSNLAKEFDIVQGLLFVKEKESDIFNIAGKYAYFGEEQPKSFKYGETLSGQVAKNKTALNLKEIPENYATILSGLGSSSPNNLLIAPIILNDETVGIIELASFKKFSRIFNDLFESISDKIGKELVKY